MLVRVIKIYRSLFHRAEEENDSTMVLDPLLSTFLTTIPLFIRRFSFQISPLPPSKSLTSSFWNNLEQHSKINKEIFLIYDKSAKVHRSFSKFIFGHLGISSHRSNHSVSPILLKSRPRNGGGKRTRKFPKIIAPGPARI